MKKFLHKVFLSVLFLFVSANLPICAEVTSSPDDCCAFAEQSPEQCKKDKRLSIQEINKFKLEFLVKEMELTGETKQKFEKLYNERMNELHPLLNKCHQTERKLKNEKNLTEDDYAQALKSLDETRDKIIEIETKYDAKFDKFLTKKQMYKMRDGERKFRETLRKMPKGKKQGRK